MKATALAAVLCAVAMISIAECQFTRNSLYRFSTPAQCTGLLNLRRGLIAKSCPGCAATPVPWNGAAIGYAATDFNCLIKTFYPTPAVFTSYQAVEKGNAAYQSAKKLATLNANFMQAGR